MSMYWGYHCKTCPQDQPADEYDETAAWSETRMNHGEATLRNIAILAPHLKAICEGDSTGYLEVSVMGHGPELVFWVIEHEGHDIELVSESSTSMAI